MLEGSGAFRPLSSSELTDWQAFFDLEPFGEMAEMHRAGKIAAAVYQAGGVGRGRKRWKATDFFPALAGDAPPAKEPQSAQDMAASIAAWNRVLGGKDKRPARA